VQRKWGRIAAIVGGFALLVGLRATEKAAGSQPATPTQSKATVAEAPHKAAPAKPSAKEEREESPRTLEGYVEQEKAFYDFLKKNHPLFTDY
jgi:hypothetical protein